MAYWIPLLWWSFALTEVTFYHGQQGLNLELTPTLAWDLCSILVALKGVDYLPDVFKATFDEETTKGRCYKL